MPLYEYQCLQCGDRFEVIQKFSDLPLTTHDNCGGEVRKLLSAPAFQFKGTGWYITDYARKGQNGDGKKADKNGKTGSGEASASEKSEGKSESKGEAKSELAKASSSPSKD